MKSFFKQSRKSTISVTTIVSALLVFALAAALLPNLKVGAQATNLALGKTVVCSASPQFPCAEAVDGNLGTRWSSVAGLDPQWLYVDLGSTQTLSSVIIRWETAYATAFQIQLSNDATNWTNVYSTTTGTGGVQTLNISGSGRYVRFYGTARATAYGYSFWEFEVYGGVPAPTNTLTRTNTVSAATATRTSTAGPTSTATRTSTRTNTPAITSTFTRTLTGLPWTPTATRTNTATATTAAGCGATNVALGKTTTASSLENAGTPASSAVDGNTTATRWSSAATDPQWIYIDLGASYNICRVRLFWEAAYGTAYQIQTSADAVTWNPIYVTTTGDGGTDDLTGLSGTGRYVRMYGTVRATGYGYSLFEFEIYSGSGPVPTVTVTQTVPAGYTSTPTKTNTAPVITNTPTQTVGASPTKTATASATTAITATKTATPSITPTFVNGCPATNFAVGRPSTTSSVAGTAAGSRAVDGDGSTRWESAAADPQWIQLDFGASATFCRVVLKWEAAYASGYQIQTSPDAANWTTIYTTTTGDGATDDLTVSGSGRYLRMYGTTRATGWGYSLYEFEAYGTGGGTIPTPTAAPTWANPIDLGPNVAIFDPSMSTASIQAKLDQVFAIEETNQFGPERYAFLFKPGTYAVNANIGFNTQISGLGFSPDDVTVNGVTADAQWFGGNATQNFWRVAENMRITPPGGNNIWAVSQAAPFRRMHVVGSLQLDPSSHGWSSGGFLADTKVDGQAASGSQQQYMARNSQIGSWTNCVWNCVFLGTAGAPAQSFPNPPYTTIGQTPVIREKPFLYVDASNNYFVFVPGLRTNVSGTSWYGQTPAGTSLPISQFYIVKPGATAADMNAALAAGKDLLVTPGVYHLNQTLNITRANTVVLGMGMATFINDNGIVAIKIADVDGVKLAGILIDAGTVNAPILIEVGPSGSSANHAANPTSLHDVFVRIGGAVAGKADVSVMVNSNNVIIDHTWLWRGDHGAGIGWTVNTAKNGLVVNGQNVTAYGLFVEHYQQYDVLWNGNGGRTYFFQNEIGYDQPNQAAFMNGTIRGYAAYKVADTVTTHEGWGMGSYVYFNVDPTIIVDHSFEVPNTPGVLFHNLLTVSLGGAGTIMNVINNVGGPAQGTTTIPVTVISYP